MSDNDRYSRQSFLGEHAEDIFRTCRLGIVGLGGGGSHVVQQAAHVGFQRLTVFDFDTVSESNLNRLIGATEADAAAERPKGEVAGRLYHGLQSTGNFEWVRTTWQDGKDHLRMSDVVISCLDDIPNRLDIEKTCRRYLMPLVDIGMDVTIVEGDPIPRCHGQVALSLPGRHCLHCLGFHDQGEKPRYGDAGPRPQVVWSNGMLASTAVGLAVEMLTGWTKRTDPCLRLQYDGNQHLMMPLAGIKERLESVKCSHFPPDAVGDPRYPA